MLEWCIVPTQFIHGGAIDDSATTAIQLAAGFDARRRAVAAYLVRPRTEGAGNYAWHVCGLWRGAPRAACVHPARPWGLGPTGPCLGLAAVGPRCGRCSVTRRQRIDLQLLLIIRRAERQADLRGRSRSDEFDALMAVQRASR